MFSWFQAEISEAPRLAQLQEELRESNLEVENLRSENETLRQDLLNVKTRNKKLCSILVHGESKSNHIQHSYFFKLLIIINNEYLLLLSI